MGKLAKFALAGAAVAALAGSAVAATRNSHMMDVALPDGAVAHIQYYGDVAPKVTVAQRPYAAMPGFPGMWAPMAMPDFGNIDRAIAQMNRETQAMIRQSQQMSHLGTPGMDVASYGNMPAGANSVSVVSYSNGGRTCTRTTEVTSQGVGKAPKVTSNVTGDCRPSSAAPAAKGAAKTTVSLDHT